jgi:hypothetical protein
MKKLLLLAFLIPFIGYTQTINTFPWSHDFENWVSLEQDSMDDGDWALRSGSTPSVNTGPQGDHTTGSGVYFYVEASYPNYPYKTFITYTPTFDISSTPGRVLSFWYHMYGSTIGDLTVHTVENDTLYTPVFTISGDQGDQWHLANINLDSLNIGGPFKIAFVGFTGSSFYSDIAIDDLLIGDSIIVLSGCTDPLATNYDSLATYNDGSCIYGPCSGLPNIQGQINCFTFAPNQGQLSVTWDPPTNPNCAPIGFHYGVNLSNLSYTPYNVWNGNSFYNYVSSTPVSPDDYYFIIETIDGSLDTLILQIPNCGAGCTDSTATNYNPFAGIDDGSCIFGNATSCGDTVNQKIYVQLTPDTYAGETSWNVTDTSGAIIISEAQGFYTTTGVPVTTEYCIPVGVEFVFNLFDSYGDGMCGSCFSGVDGQVVVTDACGDTIFSLIPSQGDNANFGNQISSNPFTLVECAPINPLYGCKDPSYLEYNSLATYSDSLMCLTLAVPGCIDSNAFNYDPNANTMDLIPNCDYTLELFDGGGDGWDFSYIGIVQDGNEIGAFTCHGNNNFYTINVSALSHIEITFYEVFNQQGTSTDITQCGFKLRDPNNNIVYQKGNNPWLNPIQPGITYTPTLNCGNYCIPFIYGCIDTLAHNFDSQANTDDGSCVYQPGCTNPLYLEYHIQGFTADVDDGSCVTLVVNGCTDSTAFNYDPLANLDNGGCIAKAFGCTDSTMFNYDINANTDDGSCVPFLYGCTDATAFNYDINANTDDGSCIPVVFGCTDNTMFNYDPNANTEYSPSNCEPVIYGCTDSTAFNYNNLANVSDGSCIPVLLGCTDSTAINYNSLANTDDGSCIAELLGCTDSTAINYNALANTDDGSCIATVLGCTDSTQFNYNPLANTNDGSCVPYIYGCTDLTMFNYNVNANTDDGSCIPFIYGCTDPTMWNYDLNANTDNGSCIPFIYGCTDSTQYNYDPLANTDNGTCIPFIYGCTDPLAYNYDPLANTTDNSCCLIAGCTDSTALNYNQFACFDDNSCITIVTGCTDVAAYNYNPLANVLDSTACLYDAGCYGGPGVPYWLNDGCYAWVIDVDDYCCNVNWDASCQSMYDYCTQGWPTTVEDISSLGIVVFPNPTKDLITIETRLEIKVEIYDIMGKLLIEKENIKRLDLSDLANGLYNLSIIYNNKRYSKQIIKQ